MRAANLGRRDRGAIAVEFVLLVPVLVLIAAMVVAGARIWWARTSVAQLASSAARQASISRTASDAQSSAGRLVHADAVQGGVRCGGAAEWPVLDLDLSGFAIDVGQAAQVTATVRCGVPLSDLILPGIPGVLPVEATASSPLDRFRSRG